MRLSILLGGTIAMVCFACNEAQTSPAGAGKPATKTDKAAAPAADKGEKPEPSAEDIAKSKMAAQANLKFHVPPPTDLIKVISGLKSGDQKIDLVPYVEEMNVDDDKPKSKQAFAAGILVADFFIYAEAKNKKEASRVAKSLGEAAKRLVPDDKDIAAQGDSIAKAIDKDDWSTAMTGVDEVYGKFKQRLAEGENAALASYVALGAWAESLYVLSGFVDSKYDEQVSKYMRQASLAKSLSEKVVKETDGEAFARELNQAVSGVEAQVSVAKEAPIPAAKVKKVREILRNMRKRA